MMLKVKNFRTEIEYKLLVAGSLLAVPCSWELCIVWPAC